MDVAQPITAVAPSLDGPVLAALAATTKPLSLAEVHALAGKGSKSGVRTVLLRLAHVGLVEKVPGGYLLNRDHLAAPAVGLLATMHGELSRRIRGVIEGWPVRPLLVGLFGSTSRRDGDTGSDIEILVVSEDPDLDVRIDDLAALVRRWTGNRAHIVRRTPEDIELLRLNQEPILSEWTRDLVAIAGNRNVITTAA